MIERVAVRRRAHDVLVIVTQRYESSSVQWQERVLGPTPASIRTAVRFCREKCIMLQQGVDQADNEAG